MANRYYHIAATVDRTLCGLLVSGPSSRAIPWPDWLDLYSQLYTATCPTCRKIAWRSGDRARALRAADLNAQKLALDELEAQNAQDA